MKASLRPYQRVYTAAYTVYSRDPRVKREAEALAEAGYYVCVLSLRDDSYPRRRVEYGVEVVYTRQGRYMGSSLPQYILSYLRFLFSVFLWLSLSALRGERFIVHLHTLPDFIVFAAIVPKMLGMPVVLDCHDLIAEAYCTKFALAREHPFARFMRWQTRICARLADIVLTVHEPLRRTLVGYGVPPSKIQVVLNTADERLFSPERRRLPNEHQFIVVSHGTIAQRLGFDLIVQVVAILRKEVPNLKVRLLGTGDAESQVRALIDQLGVGDIVDFPNGSVPVEEISYHIGSAHVGVVATRKDDTTELMLPLKLSEYLAMGIPVVCSRLRVVEEYTQGKGVLFYDHNDPQDLANALLRLYRDPVFLQRLTDETGFFRAQYSWKEQKLTLRKIFTALGGIEL